MNKKTLMVVGFAVFAAIAGVLLVWGIGTHEEAGFMEVCWENDKVNSIRVS